MRTRTVHIALLACGLITFAALPVASAQTVDKPAKVVSTVIKQAMIVEAVDKSTRELKLIDAQGHRFAVVAGDHVRNFDQIEARDRIVLEYLESVAVVIAPAGSEPLVRDAAAVAVAPAGDKPGIEGVETRLVLATVQGINEADRLLTIKDESGALRTVKVAPDAPLYLVNVGDQVRLRVTRAMAVNIVKPD